MKLKITERIKQKAAANTQLSTMYRIAAFTVWIGIIAACIIHRDRFTIEGIIGISPEKQSIAFLVFMALFALKSASLVLYSGVLYAAIGLVFPLPLELLTSFCGSVIMFTVPYFIGRAIGRPALSAIEEKYPKAAMLQSLRGDSDFLSAMIIRLIGVIPYDPASLFLGAVGMKYLPYLAGSLCGFIPFMLIMSFVGNNAQEPGSPEFLIAVGIKLIETLASIIACAVLWRRFRRNKDIEV